MKKIDWVRKLTSRKLWTAVASFVSMTVSYTHLTLPTKA